MNYNIRNKDKLNSSEKAAIANYYNKVFVVALAEYLGGSFSSKVHPFLVYFLLQSSEEQNGKVTEKLRQTLIHLKTFNPLSSRTKFTKVYCTCRFV